MADRAPVDTSEWSPIRWSEFPVAFRGHPDHWPEPHRPSTRRVLWWRTAAVAVGIAIFGFAAHRGASPPGDDGRSSLEVVALSYAALLSLVLVAVTWVVAGWSFVKEYDPINEVVQKTRTARREMARALRRGAPVPDDRRPLLHLWIVRSRAEMRRGHLIGYCYAAQLALITGNGWFTSVWLVLTSLGVLLLVVGVAREMAFRYWESGVAGRTTDRLDSHPPSVESTNRPTGTTDGG